MKVTKCISPSVLINQNLHKREKGMRCLSSLSISTLHIVQMALHAKTRILKFLSRIVLIVPRCSGSSSSPSLRNLRRGAIKIRIRFFKLLNISCKKLTLKLFIISSNGLYTVNYVLAEKRRNILPRIHESGGVVRRIIIVF